MKLKNIFRSRTSAATAAVEMPEVGSDPTQAGEPPGDRLGLAREAMDENLGAINELNRRAQEAQARAEPARAAASAAQSVRQEREAIIARQLGAGDVDLASMDLRDVDARLATAEAAERQSAAVLTASASLIADLNEQARQRVTHLAVLRRELAEAQFEAATAEIRQEQMTELRSAAAAYGKVYARLAGAGRAHHKLADQLREQHGVNVQALGVEYPARDVALHPVGFGFADGGQYNTVHLDLGADIDAAAAAALARWRAA